ncbi:hypothetical protein Tco_0574206 [Tanacetum coccineum]
MQLVVDFDSGQDGGQVVVDFLEGLMGKIGERKRGNKRSLWLSEEESCCKKAEHDVISFQVLLNNRVQTLYLIVLWENSSAHQVVRQAPDKQKEQSSFDAATVANKEAAAYNEIISDCIFHSATSYGVTTNDNKLMIEGYPQKAIFPVSAAAVTPLSLSARP